ncbi:hypothetical protein [Nonomuraea rubra]|uniref:HEAT repeat domain-containing protein n=1 Tax=Nonomuraea rubra TaxID=46180 RepID=A0A7X0TXK4_9ACTN|nr:hypothetical protein [Nonomuraea rubra]MBB6547274.1 hypothetical protein [Nonomuraea rubra]
MISGRFAAVAPSAPSFDEACESIAREPGAIRSIFPAAARRWGGGPSLFEGWGVEDVTRVLLVAALPLTGDDLAAEVEALYRAGGADEKRAVLLALALLGDELGDRALALVLDALGTDEPHLVTAALGAYAARWLPPGADPRARPPCPPAGTAPGFDDDRRP